MNFLAHYLLATRARHTAEARPAYVVGTALPDLLTLAAPHRHLRLTTLHTAPASTVEEQALAQGVRMHLATDAAFHKAAAFLAAQERVGRLVTDAGFVGIRVRRFFLAHVLVELALDAVLLRRDPRLADDFYAAFAGADRIAVTRWAESALVRPLPLLPGVLERFRQSRYLGHYAADDGVAEGLSRLSLRAHQDPFRGDNRSRLVVLVSRAVAAMNDLTDVLVSETASQIVFTYPLTTEK